MVVKGEGRTLLGRETAETNSLLHDRPLPGNSVVSEHSQDDGGIEICLQGLVFSKVMSLNSM